MKKPVNISDAPKPIAPYSQAILSGNTLYVSGQIAIDPYTGKLVEGGAAEQTKRVMENIGVLFLLVFWLCFCWVLLGLRVIMLVGLRRQY